MSSTQLPASIARVDSHIKFTLPQEIRLRRKFISQPSILYSILYQLVATAWAIISGHSIFPEHVYHLLWRSFVAFRCLVRTILVIWYNSYSWRQYILDFTTFFKKILIIIWNFYHNYLSGCAIPETPFPSPMCMSICNSVCYLIAISFNSLLTDIYAQVLTNCGPLISAALSINCSAVKNKSSLYIFYLLVIVILIYMCT